MIKPFILAGMMVASLFGAKVVTGEPHTELKPVEIYVQIMPVLECGFGAEEYAEEAEEIEPVLVGTIEKEPLEHLFGTCTITHYCACSSCCGKWAGGSTASGTVPTAGRTVAVEGLPFGTQIRIEGLEGIYTVEDRGVSGFWVDIFCDSHTEALQRGMYQADVYIID